MIQASPSSVNAQERQPALKHFQTNTANRLSWGVLAIVTDKLRPYGAAMRILGNADRHECNGRSINDRAENSHQPVRQRERAMHRLRHMGTLKKFTFVHAALDNHFNHERHLTNRTTYKLKRAGAMVEWKRLVI